MLLSAALVALAAAAVAMAVPTVQTTTGPVDGVPSAHDGAAYLGIPFAKPPKRWGAPQSPDPWTTPFKATSYGM
jgi:para-nitrobenzyl esterase